MRVIGMFTMIALTTASAIAGRETRPTTSGEVRLVIEGRASATPWVAARGDFVAVAWGATEPTGGADVYVAVSRDAGATFGPSRRVNKQPGTARLGGELPPRVALGPATSTGDPSLTVVWGARFPTTQIRVARSEDGGGTFASHQILSPPSAAGDRGWHALTIDEGGTPHVMWLDHRRLAARPKTAHDHHGDGADMAQFSGLYYSRADAAATERELAKGVCYCCKVALAAGAGDTVYAAWRHVYPGNIRDIAFFMSRDGGRTFSEPVRVSTDNWQLAGCPDDGPAMAVGDDGTVHLVWPTMIGDETPQGALFYASTRDGGRFSPRLRIPTRGSPKPSHPQIVLQAGGGVVVAWDEVIDGVRQASARALRFDRAGQSSFGEVVSIGAGASSMYPVLATTSRGLLAVWTRGTGGASEVVVGRTQLP